MYKITPLIDFVPVYKVYESNEFLHNENPINDEQCSWVEKLKEKGNIGEKIVEKYIIQKYTGSIVKKQLDHVGYDFQVCVGDSVSCVEVKTTNEGNNRFFMSSNEVRIAKEKEDMYYVFFVCLNKYDGGTIYVIKNPFVVLGLNKIYEQTEINESALLKINSLEITITNFDKFNFIKDDLSSSIIKEFLNDN